jgi:hypothetical protein
MSPLSERGGALYTNAPFSHGSIAQNVIGYLFLKEPGTAPSLICRMTTTDNMVSFRIRQLFPVLQAGKAK